ncbi:MAG: hypothetical protein ACREO1_15025 [Arenimonas sp.]
MNVPNNNDPFLPDDGFSIGVMTDLNKSRLRRRYAFVITAALATFVNLIAFFISPERMPEIVGIGPGNIVSALFLLTLCSIGLINSDSPEP